MILAITSSGRRPSNSTILASMALQAAATTSAVEAIDLSKMNFRGCVGCGACRSTSDICVQTDDLTPVLARIPEASGLILATPVYYGYVNGIFKSFLDRWYAYRDAERKLRMKPDRPLLYILTQGHPDPDVYGQVWDSLDKTFTAYGFKPRRFVAAGLEKPGAAARSFAHIDLATGEGSKLAASAARTGP